MNALLREHGFGVSLIVGIVLIVIGILPAFQPLLVVIGGVFVAIGVVAQPIEEIVLKEGRVKWQRAAAQAVHRKLEERVISRTVEDHATGSDDADAKVTRGSGNVVVSPAPARLRLRAFEPTVITRPQSPDEFADTLVEQIIEPAFIASEDPDGQ